MAISEKVELLGGDYYKDSGIPKVLTLTSIPTASELEYVSAEDFDETMISTILPKAVEEDVDFNKLLEVDYQWVLRCLRIINYGPYHTTNVIRCPQCGALYGDFQVNLQAVNCIPLPADFKGEFTIKRDEFIDYQGDIKFKMLTIREALNALKDPQFEDKKTKKLDRRLARLCYSIISMGTDTHLNPVEVRLKILKELSAADYIVLEEMSKQLTNYGLRAGGNCTCHQCGNKEAVFIAPVDDRYFRPTLGDLRTWKADKRKREAENTARGKTNTVRKHN